MEGEKITVSEKDLHVFFSELRADSFPYEAVQFGEYCDPGKMTAYFMEFAHKNNLVVRQ